MPASWFNHRREADALQEALERYEGLVGAGIDPIEATREAGDELDAAAARLFTLTVGLRRAAAPAPEPSFAHAFEARLRSARVVRRLPPRRRVGLPGVATIAAAACVAVLAGVLFSASQSLPGDALYAFKRASESAQIAVSSGPGEARLRLELAAKRLEEVEKLVLRSGNQVFGAPGTTVAAGVDRIGDPELGALIQETLAEAEHQITEAAEILISGPADRESLDRLAEVAGRGKTIAVNVAADLPRSEVSPVLDTAVALAEVEAKAKAASEKAALPPCATPTPSPTPTAEQSPTPTPTVEPTETPSPTSTAKAEEPAPTPTPTPTGTPCASPSPTPTPTPTPTQSPEVSPATSDEPAKPSKTTEPGTDNRNDQAQEFEGR